MIENPTEEQLRTLKGIVYCIENKINGKKYIGQSYRSFYKRYRAKKNWWKNSHNEMLKRAIKKYKIKNFKISILEHNIPDDNNWLDNLEVFYIKLYNSIYPNGYNFDSGGNNNRKICLESRNKKAKTYIIKDKLENIYNITNGTEFCKQHNINTGDFWRMLSGKQLHAKGFYLPETDTRIIRRDRGTNGITILKDKNGIIYNIYDTEKFCKENNLNSHSLNSVINKQNKTLKGWRLPETPLNLKYEPGNKKWEKIILEKDNIIYEITSGKEFVEKTKLCLYSIYSFLKGTKEIKKFKLINIILKQKLNLIQSSTQVQNSFVPNFEI